MAGSWLRCSAKLAGCVAVGAFLAIPPAHAAKQGKEEFASAICAAADASARKSGIDPSFFVRLLWKESLFDPLAVSHKGAQGIAQFMPETARRRGLADPFDPYASVEASAAYLADLKKLFGNIGLAAAAYNAGEDRVQRWRLGKASMPLETQDYVAFVTGKEVEAWKDGAAAHAVPLIGEGRDLRSDCVKLALRVKPPPSVRLATGKPWGVLLAAHFQQQRALAMYQRLKLRAPQVLGNADPMVLRKRNLSRGTRAMAMVYVGAESREEAGRICGQLQSRGVPCLVQKTR